MAPLADQLLAETRRIVREALIETGGNATAAARGLGISVRQIFRYKAELLTDHDRNVIAAEVLRLGSKSSDPAREAAAGMTSMS